MGLGESDSQLARSSAAGGQTEALIMIGDLVAQFTCVNQKRLYCVDINQICDDAMNIKDRLLAANSREAMSFFNGCSPALLVPIAILKLIAEA
jgi:hypothetical protein